MIPIESVMQFKGYRVLQAQYIVNEKAPKTDGKLPLDPSFRQTIKRIDENICSLILGVKVGGTDSGSSLPFYAIVEVEGVFVFSGTQHIQKLMETNATAILFPYLRSALSMLTVIANVNPVVLPTINLARMFEENHKSNLEKDDIVVERDN